MQVLVDAKNDEFYDNEKPAVLEQVFSVAVEVCTEHEKTTCSRQDIPGVK